MKREILLLSSLFMLSFQASAALLTSLKINENTILMRFIDNPTHHVFVLKNPDRLVIDLNHTDTRLNTAQMPIHSSLAKNVRSGHPDPSTLRLVIETKEPIQVGTLNTQKQADGCNQLKIQLIKASPAILTNNPLHFSAKALPHPLPIQTHQKYKRDVVIILDPGHGGKDPGAIGPHRHQEKDVVLAIAYKLKQFIDKQPGMKAILTRRGDYFVGLRERLNIARRYDGDVFISIHADAYINQASNGASVFALSQTGATSEAARWLAEKENYSELGGVNLSGLDDENGLIRTVLIDLSQTATIGASLKLGSHVLESMDTLTTLHNNKVEQARFVVLKSPDIPSILIETGFITNWHEERNLTNPVYQTRLTQSIFSGIKRYFWKHPPPGTLLESLSGVTTHVVQAKETWTSIAAQYHTTVTAIQAANPNVNQSLQSGQKLVIPSSWA